MKIEKPLYPFTAIVGQEQMKKALILNAINPNLGGVLIRGEKGTAKSTAVRALAKLLPEREEIKECLYHCDPANQTHWCESCGSQYNEVANIPSHKGKMRVVDLPVSATEDRLIGTLDIEHAIKKGEKRFETGILAKANRNILYVDEVNLLDDHLVDVLLDSAAMGVNTIEREGVSYTHPSRFILVGTMNPEEGDLRPQLLDRFGMVVEVGAEQDPEKRMTVIRNRLGYEQNPETFCKAFEQQQNDLCQSIEAAKKILPSVVYEDAILEMAALIGIELKVDGHRADLSMIKTAMTIAAYHGRTEVVKTDLLEAAELVLPHRMRRTPFEEQHYKPARIKEIIDRF